MNSPRQQIQAKLDQLFGDTSRPASETLVHLEWVEAYTQELIQTLRDDGVEPDDE